MRAKTMIGAGTALTAGAAAAATVGTLTAYRASSEERRRALPNDRIVQYPMYVVTQAVTIDAPP